MHEMWRERVAPRMKATALPNNHGCGQPPLVEEGTLPFVAHAIHFHDCWTGSNVDS